MTTTGLQVIGLGRHIKYVTGLNPFVIIQPSPDNGVTKQQKHTIKLVEMDNTLEIDTAYGK